MKTKPKSDSIIVESLEWKYSTALDDLEKAEKEVAGRKKGLRALQEAHHAARVRLQLAMWGARGKRFCPECGQLRGAKTFVWLYLVDWPGSGFLFTTRYDKRIVLCCRQCEREIFRLKRGSRHRYYQATRVRKDGNQFLIMTPPPSSFETVDLRPYKPLVDVFDEETLKQIGIVEFAPKFEINDLRFTVGRNLHTIK